MKYIGIKKVEEGWQCTLTKFVYPDAIGAGYCYDLVAPYILGKNTKTNRIDSGTLDSEYMQQINENAFFELMDLNYINILGNENGKKS